MKDIIIAIDGYSGTGKSSTAKALAATLGYTYVDSGAMYRAVTLHFINEDISLDDKDRVEASLSNCNLNFESTGITLNNQPVEKTIRSTQINDLVSQVSTISAVRAKLVEEQRKIGSKKRVVMDGRDIGTVVFPKAELKIFMVADISDRVSRRKKQLGLLGVDESPESIERNLKSRDHIDSTRDDSPLRKAEDAIEINTSGLTIDQQVALIRKLAFDKMES
ncbi:MAG: (d)CMP kinase [Bacteroidota bacterium]